MLQQRDPCGDESTDNKERSTDPRSPYLRGVHFDILTESVINSVLWRRKRRYRGFDLGSSGIPGSYLTRRLIKLPSSALPRFRTLWTYSKNPRYRGNFSCDKPRWGRSHDRSK